jgi:hypothetical protein
MDDILKNEKYLIIDNLLNENESNLIQSKLYNSSFPWFIAGDRDDKGNMITASYEKLKFYEKDVNVVDLGQFYHSFFYIQNNKLVSNSKHVQIPLTILSNLIKIINIKNISILRAKSNLILESRKYNKNSYGIPHTDTRDINDEHYVLIYYVNNSDGDTVLFDNNKIFKKISPKKGRGLIFKGNLLHANGHPVESSTRCVINFNLQLGYTHTEGNVINE